MKKDIWFFRIGDIITSFLPDSEWHEKRIRVEMIEIGENKLWGTVIGDDFLSSADDPLGLTLLERQNYPLKVGDKIIAIEKIGELKRGNTGEIIVINPMPRIIFPFLAEFDNDFQSGHKDSNDWLKPWFPQQRKTSDRNNRLWISGSEGMISKYIP